MTDTRQIAEEVVSRRQKQPKPKREPKQSVGALLKKLQDNLQQAKEQTALIEQKRRLETARQDGRLERTVKLTRMVFGPAIDLVHPSSMPEDVAQFLTDVGIVKKPRKGQV